MGIGTHTFLFFVPCMHVSSRFYLGLDPTPLFEAIILEIQR